MKAMFDAGMGAETMVLALLVVLLVHLTFRFALRATVWVSLTDGLVMDALGTAARNLAGTQLGVEARADGSHPIAPASMHFPSNSAARAAQRLFRRETGGWLTTHHAPAQGKDVLTRAYALMSVYPAATAATALDQARLIARWREFLIDAVGLITLGRSELLVDLRTKVYSDLRCRPDQLLDTAFAPDAAEERLLWPLRERHSWDLIKDHVLPLLSAALSVIALLRTFG